MDWGRWAWEQEQSGLGKMTEESTEKDNWSEGHLWSELETECNGSSQESMRVTLSRILAIGDTVSTVYFL